MWRRFARLGLVCIGVIVPLAVLETASRLQDVRPAAAAESDSSPGYYARDEVLGYAPANASTSRARRRHAHDVIYDVTYTIGPNRLRISPSTYSPDSSRCALFFGDSFTFGEGVNDRETMPYLVGELSNYHVYNFGFHGYGPHQMLAEIQSGRVARTVQCQPRFILYQAIPDHPWRAAGRAPWDAHGPKYSVIGNALIQEGHFDDRRIDRVRRRIRTLASRSSAYRRYIDARVSREDITRFAAIVNTARAELHALYPAAAFHVLLWDPSPGAAVSRDEHSALLAADVATHLSSEILPQDAAHPLQYALSPWDNHPSPATHRLIAEFVVNLFGDTR